MSPPEADITELPSSPGARLRREREARGITEQLAAESLNLDPAVVTLLEANDFGKLGAPVFVKGHLRRYASFLGLAEDEIVGAYERSKLQVDEPTLVPKSRLEMAPVRERPRWPWVLGGAIAFVLAAALAAYLSERGLPGSSTDDETPAAASSTTKEGERPADTAAAPVPAQATSPQAPSTDASAAPAGEAAPTATEAAVTPTDTAAQPPTAAPGPGQVVLSLKFTSDSWVEIFDGTGKAVLYDLGKAGTERSLTATAPLSVTLGNGPGVTIAVNGRTLPAPPRAAGDVVARFGIAPDGTLR